MNASSQTATAADPVPSGRPQADDEQLLPTRIIGIGASAGGLAAFQAFFSGLIRGATSDAAFVLVQHLAPDHDSMLTELIARYTSMRVFEVEDGHAVHPNCVYVIPPNRILSYAGGVLRLTARDEDRARKLPIDSFFASLATELGERAVGVVLSGSGHDGTEGIMAIKRAGGLAFAQNPESAEYPDMPRSAIATGMVDSVLPPAEMGAQIMAHVKSTVKDAALESTTEEQSPQGIKGIIEILQAQAGHDFSNYKPSTIERRIQRRMMLQKINDFEQYEQVLRSTPTEVEALFQDLLIGVTSFFRDAEAFEALEQVAIPALFKKQSKETRLRVWVPACSTGEEAYSIAILLREHAEATNSDVHIQIFATDIDPRAIATARGGVYPESISKDVSPERLGRYFLQQEDGRYRVEKGVRDLLVFSEQDLTQDPPFSRLDLISCRNLLIYLDAKLQSRLMSVFHYGLRPSGWLLLGTSETVGDVPTLFQLSDRNVKLYQRKEGEGRDPPHRVAQVHTGQSGGGARPVAPKSPSRKKLPLRELTEAALLEDAPVAALVTEVGDVLYVHGQTGQYLQPAPGEMAASILKMAREGLRHELNRALRESGATGHRATRSGIRVKTNGDFTRVDVSVKPVRRGLRPGDSALYLVVFEKAKTEALGQHVSVREAGSASTESNTAPAEVLAARIVVLTQELQSKDAYLETIQEDMLRTNEDFKHANEELQSANEELQSTNEELETSKEELQSVNEELATVNAELQSKVSDLSRVNDDMNNLLAGNGVGTVFLDNELRVRRFTPAITQFINLIQSDIGRPIGHIVSNLKGYDRLVPDVRAVFETLTPSNVSVTTHDGTPYQLRIVPYRTSANVVDGAVVTFSEVMASEGTSSKQGDEP